MTMMVYMKDQMIWHIGTDGRMTGRRYGQLLRKSQKLQQTNNFNNNPTNTVTSNKKKVPSGQWIK